MLNVQMYTQMGYTQSQVLKAHELSKKNKIDMFDALQQVQNRQSNEKQKKLQTNVPFFSYLNHIKNINLNQYEVVYSKNGIKFTNYARDQIRQLNTPVGLFNVSNCCYLNSLLQCYFLMGSFTRQILAAEQIDQLPQQSSIKNKKIKNQYLLLSALKEMLAKLKLSSRRYLDPTPVLKNLVNSVGQKIQYGDEKDLHQINMQIVQRLSQCLMYTKRYYSKGEASPSKIKKKQNIKNLFYGQKVQFIQNIQGQIISQFMGVILNPKYDNILQAIQQQFNYDVQIQGKTMKKHTFIRKLPQYLFFTISRANFQKKQQQLLKNSEKISFDFIIYLDQYLQINKEEARVKNPKIKDLQNRKSVLKSQLNHLNILAQKLQQCREHAKYLENWQEKLPKIQSLQTQKNSFKKQIQQIEQELSQIQSRKQKYTLMYLFVHRGDAISGHYWGYGKNGNYWYRFDVNCSSIKESHILVDMQKSGGIPYALVYAKDDHIQSFAYPYYTELNHQFFPNFGPIEKQDYVDLIPMKLKKQIIDQNKAMHQSIERQKIKNIVDNVIKDYKIKYNIVKSQVQKYDKTKNNPNIPLYTNFAFYLESIKKTDLMKSNIFANSVFSKAQITCSQLLTDQNLLKSIQKSFRKKVKGKMGLRHFAIQCQPIEGDRYKKLATQYIVGKKCLEFIKFVYNNLKQWPKIENLKNYLEDIVSVLKSCNIQGIYVKNITTQLIAIILLDLVAKGEPIKLSWANSCQKHNPLLLQQLKSESKFKQIPEGKQLDPSPIGKIQLETDWSVQSLKKGFENELIEAIKNIINELKEGLSIYKINTKQKKIVKSSGQKKIQANEESLI